MTWNDRVATGHEGSCGCLVQAQPERKSIEAAHHVLNHGALVPGFRRIDHPFTGCASRIVSAVLRPRL